MTHNSQAVKHEDRLCTYGILGSFNSNTTSLCMSQAFVPADATEHLPSTICDKSGEVPFFSDINISQRRQASRGVAKTAVDIETEGTFSMSPALY